MTARDDVETQMERVAVGLIGYGFAGSVFHAPIIATVDALALTTVVSSKPDAVRRDFPGVTVVPDADALFLDSAVELVVIATPNPSHFPLAKRALEAGKHVVVEKPFVIRVAEADELLRLAAEHGRMLSVYHNRRWDGDFRTVQQCVESGVLGRITTYEARFDRFRPQVVARWREQAGEGSGTLYDLGSHLIDQALCLFGLPQIVSADVGTQRAGAQTVDYFHLVLGYGELRVILHGSSLVRKPVLRFAVHGDRGSFVKRGMDPQEAALKRGERPGDPGWGEEPGEQHGELVTEMAGLTVRGHVETLPGCYECYYQGIARAILGGTPPPVSAADARNTIGVIEAATRSSEEGRVVRFVSEFA